MIAANSAGIDNTELYRLPWTLPDNGISWLEPTILCNLKCDGCYRKIESDPHKPWQRVMEELDVFQSKRKSDCISIAGGDPLLYPKIVELVREVRRRGLKPIVNTNGVALTPRLLLSLKEAGVFGFTFHVDSHQNRGGEWEGKSELELNELRLRYASMVAEVGGIACSFNSTVYAENLEQVPGMMAWAQEHIDKVQTMVFICFRYVVPSMPFDWYAGDQLVPWEKIWYSSGDERVVSIDSRDLVAKAREDSPEFQPAAYLNGTHDPEAFKWLLTQRVGTREGIHGFLGPKFVELMMAGYHLFKGRYLSYASPSLTRTGRLSMFLGSLFDREARKSLRSYLGGLLRNPLRLFRRSHLQSIMFIQPVDILANGEQSMCDGCPDITVHEGELVWSCRLEELKHHGTFLRSVPRCASAAPCGPVG